MKVVILAGGLGSRLSEETDLKPKPMIEIGGKPILWHIMKIYSHYGFNEFIILLGYKGYMIKEYFADYYLHQSDVTFDIASNTMEYHTNKTENWKVTLLDTGIHTMTGGRIKKIKEYIGNSPFMLTYGDGVADIDISKLIDFHKKSGGFITLTSVLPEGKFGALEIDKQQRINSFQEKPKGDGSWVNGGFFVCQPEVLDYIDDGEQVIFEREPLQNLANDGELFAYNHKGFWKPMDTLRDKEQLHEMVLNIKALWVKL